MDGLMCGKHLFPLGEEGYCLSCIEDDIDTPEDTINAIYYLIRDCDKKSFETHSYMNMLQDIMHIAKCGYSKGPWQ